MILVADDNRAVLAQLSATLRDAGHPLLEACDGNQAWDLIGRHAPRIAILDWMMPGLDGLELCRRIRRDPRHAHMYVLLLDARRSLRQLATGLEAGADDCLTRPFTSDELNLRLLVALRAIEARNGNRPSVDPPPSVTERLEGIGQLAAGIAHEINTPIQYIGDNLRFLGDSVASLDPLLALVQDLADGRSTATSGETGTAAALRACASSVDLRFLRTHMTRGVVEALEGIEHVSSIVRAMREFSHPGGQRELLDVNKAIESTLVLARGELKHVADVRLQLDPALPLAPCAGGEIRQALLNLVINAAHAIGDTTKERGTRGAIAISTLAVDGDVEIRIEDRGAGIPEAIRERVFEPFFTTKATGRGTGQGLAIAHATIVTRHQGRIWFESEQGRGTTFFVRLPVAGA
jgi:signal transduction histidine kinase